MWGKSFRKVGAFIVFIIGLILTMTLFGAVIGIPLIFLSIALLLAGIFVPGRKKEIHIHHHNKK